MFAPNVLRDLKDNLASLRARYVVLAEAYISFQFKSDRAREYATHGYLRRLGMMKHCTTRVFQLLPPELDDPPDDDVLLDATAYIQAFVMNVFGALDNLAWIWVSERALKVVKTGIGLGPKSKVVRTSFSPEMQGYLSGLEPWFEHIVDFRDALAHRIPLFIPPHRIPPENEAAYMALEARKWATRDLDEYGRLKIEQLKLVVFQPVMKHTLHDDKPPVVFHFQLLQDFATVEEIGEKVLLELKRI
jgi:hypothetical protein